MRCSLCGSTTQLYSEIKKRVYYQCHNCDAILLKKEHFLNRQEERKRYETHNNDVNDIGYRNFVSPIVNGVLEDYSTKHNGLDFGSGSGPVISVMLREKRYNITTYDPFFDPNLEALSRTYDYIACCEVMEHFYNPNKEFLLLASLMRKNASLYCKTTIFDRNTTDFENWWYKNDPSHVFFYTKNTLDWIATHFNFKALEIKKDVIIFRA